MSLTDVYENLCLHRYPSGPPIPTLYSTGTNFMIYRRVTYFQG